MKASRNQPMCEACWIGHQGLDPADHIPQPDEGGWPAGLFLPIVRRPALVDPGTTLNQCAWCGKPTMIGLWVRIEREAAEALPFAEVE